MPLGHMSEEQIQTYLDTRDAKRDQALVLHIRRCPECRAKLHEYRILYRGLKAADEPDISDSFTDNTMKAIRALSATAPQASRSSWLAYGGILVPLVVAIQYFFGTSWISEIWRMMLGAITWKSQPAVVETILKTIGSIQDGATIVAAAIIILALAGVLDKAMAKAKLRKISPLSL